MDGLLWISFVQAPREAVVEAFFEFPENVGLREHFVDQGISFDGELVIKRNISREGRNKIFINGAMVTLQMLSGLGPRLISISGQHEHQTLLNPENHLALLDDFSSLTEERTLFRQMFNRYQALKEEIDDLKKGNRAAKGKEGIGPVSDSGNRAICNGFGGG